MSLYSEYLKERTNDCIIETDGGFAVYRYLEAPEKAVYIVDIYTKPELRKMTIASSLADEIADEARAKGYKEMLGSVQPSAKASTTSLRVLLAYGFELKSAGNDFIVFRKDI